MRILFQYYLRLAHFFISSCEIVQYFEPSGPFFHRRHLKLHNYEAKKLIDWIQLESASILHRQTYSIISQVKSRLLFLVWSI